MKNYIQKFIENEDFASEEEYFEEVKKDKNAVMDYLKWRVNGGKSDNEILPNGYRQAAKEALDDLMI